RLNTDLALHRINETQKTAFTIEAIDQRLTAELNAINKAEESDDLSAKQKQNLENEKTRILQQAARDRNKASEQETLADVKAWESMLQPIQGAWNSQLQRLLAGTETFSEAMRNIFSQLAIQIIEKLESIAVQKLALSLATAFGDP